MLNKIRNDEDSINNLLELAKERMINYDVDADDEFNKKTSTSFKIIVRNLILRFAHIDSNLNGLCYMKFKNFNAGQISFTYDLILIVLICI